MKNCKSCQSANIVVGRTSEGYSFIPENWGAWDILSHPFTSIGIRTAVCLDCGQISSFLDEETRKSLAALQNAPGKKS